MRRMNAARKTAASRMSTGSTNSAHRGRFLPTSDVVQFGSTVSLRVDPARGKAENTCITGTGVSGVVTVGMRASFKCHVCDAFGNETLQDETKAFDVVVRPLSSHLPRDLIVVTSVVWRGGDGSLPAGSSSAGGTSSGRAAAEDETNKTPADDTDSSTNTYDVTYSPTQRGAYLISVKLYGKDISGSPFYVRVAETNASSLSVVTKKQGKKFRIGRPSTASSTTRVNTSPLRPRRSSLHRQRSQPRQTTTESGTTSRKANTAVDKDSVKTKHLPLDASGSGVEKSAMGARGRMLFRDKCNDDDTKGKTVSRGEVPARAKTAGRVRAAGNVQSTTQIQKHNNKKKKKKKTKTTQRNLGEKAARRPASSMGMSGPLLALCKARNVDQTLYSSNANAKKNSKTKRKRKKPHVRMRPESSLGIAKRRAQVLVSAGESTTTTNRNNTRQQEKETGGSVMPTVQATAPPPRAPNSPPLRAPLMAMPPPSDGKHEMRKAHRTRKAMSRRRKIAAERAASYIAARKKENELKFLKNAPPPVAFSYRNIQMMMKTGGFGSGGMKGSKIGT